MIRVNSQSFSLSSTLKKVITYLQLFISYLFIKLLLISIVYWSFVCCGYVCNSQVCTICCTQYIFEVLFFYFIFGNGKTNVSLIYSTYSTFAINQSIEYNLLVIICKIKQTNKNDRMPHFLFASFV